MRMCLSLPGGDLGNDVPLWELPAVQKRTAAFLRAAGKPFVIVTQMLDSMERRPVPTGQRCAIFSMPCWTGADAVMLTGETAAGKYPVQAMEYLVKTGEAAVKYLKRTGMITLYPAFLLLCSCIWRMIGSFMHICEIFLDNVYRVW